MINVDFLRSRSSPPPPPPPPPSPLFAPAATRTRGLWINTRGPLSCASDGPLNGRNQSTTTAAAATSAPPTARARVRVLACTAPCTMALFPLLSDQRAGKKARGWPPPPLADGNWERVVKLIFHRRRRWSATSAGAPRRVLRLQRQRERERERENRERQ